jgi:hypothetical protein
MKSQKAFLWSCLAVAAGLPVMIALLFEVWAGGKVPELKRAPQHPPAGMSAPLTATPAATEPRLEESPTSPAKPIATPEPTEPKSVWNTPLPAPLAGPAQPLRLQPKDVGALPYESAMLAIMRAPGPDSDKAAALFGLLPHVPEEVLANTTEQALNWLSNRNYAAIANPIITNPKTHGQVLGPMFADLMQRPEAVALPTLLQIAETPDHPFAPSAHDNLSLLVGRDLGSDWPAWQSAIVQRVGAATGP